MTFTFEIEGSDKPQPSQRSSSATTSERPRPGLTEPQDRARNTDRCGEAPPLSEPVLAPVLAQSPAADASRLARAAVSTLLRSSRSCRWRALPGSPGQRSPRPGRSPLLQGTQRRRQTRAVALAQLDAAIFDEMIWSATTASISTLGLPESSVSEYVGGDLEGNLELRRRRWTAWSTCSTTVRSDSAWSAPVRVRRSEPGPDRYGDFGRAGAGPPRCPARRVARQRLRDADGDRIMESIRTMGLAVELREASASSSMPTSPRCSTCATTRRPRCRA